MGFEELYFCLIVLSGLVISLQIFGLYIMISYFFLWVFCVCQCESQNLFDYLANLSFTISSFPVHLIYPILVY